MAGSLEEAFMVLQQLTENAISECRYDDAGYYYWIQARQCLDLAKERCIITLLLLLLYY